MSQESNHGKRPDAFERALRQNVRQSRPEGSGFGTGAPGAVCPEPELLAAYFERSLSSAESAECEKHFSICGRCQQQLAALTRSEPAPQKFPAGWEWLRSPQRIVRWLAPAVVALGAAVLWIAIRPSPSTLDQIARELPKQSPAVSAPMPPKEANTATPASADGRAQPPKALRLPNGSVVKGSKLSKQVEQEKKALGDELAISPVEKKRANLQESQNEVRSLTAKNQAATSEPAAPKPAPLKEKAAVAPEQRQALVRDAATRQKMDRVVTPPARQPEGGQTQQAAPTAAAAVGGVPATTGEQKSQARKLESGIADRPLDKQSAAAFAPKAVEQLSTPVSVLVSAPGGSVIWRIGTGGRIYRSLDAGKTWLRQESGIQTDLTNGQAVSATVCWLVGLKGTVLRTVDALQWQKIAFPLEADLARVEATDALHALVTTADGQTYATANGGQSWQKR